MKVVDLMEQDVERKKYEVTIAPEKYRPLPSDIYKARLNEVSDGCGKYGQEVFNLTFEILEGNHAGHLIKGIINKSATGLNGKLWQLIKALSQSEPDIFDQCNLLDLKDKSCLINVEKNGVNNGIREYIALRDFETN